MPARWFLAGFNAIRRIRQPPSHAVGLATEDWTIIRTAHAGLITRETQLPDGLQYFEQAEIDGEVFLFFTSPVGAPDNDTNAA